MMVGTSKLTRIFMIIWINCQRQSGVPTWPRPWRGGVDGKVSISVCPGANDCDCCDYHGWLWMIAIHFWILDDLTLSRQRTWSWRENKRQFHRLLRREHGGHSLPQVDQWFNTPTNINAILKRWKNLGWWANVTSSEWASQAGCPQEVTTIEAPFSSRWESPFYETKQPINISFIYIFSLG